MILAKEMIVAALIAISYAPLDAEPIQPVGSYDLDIMAHLIMGEAGADYCTEDLQYYVGSVVLNRVNSPYFPNTIEEVVFQEGQYECTWIGTYDWEPTERIYEIAEDLLENGSWLPESVVFQAEFLQGDGLYLQEQNMYFCYKE